VREEVSRPVTETPAAGRTNGSSNQSPWEGTAGVVRPSTRSRALGNLRRWGASVLILVGLLVAWEVWVQVGNVPKWQLPAPTAIAQELVNSWGLLWGHTLVTLQEVVLGFLTALVTGLLLAAGIAYSRVLERSVYPLVIASQTIPIIAIAPLLLIWVGYGIAPKVIVVALISFFPISVNTVDGLRSVDPDMLNMMRTLGASRWQIFTKLQVPASLPQMFTGIKIGVAVSVIGAVIGEWVGASAGLGYLMTYSQPLFLTARVFAAIVVLSVMGIALFLMATLLERLMLPWYHTEKRARSLDRI
jgi:putative hydroxymethylpyrimidine transport system permease protein